MNIPIPQHGGRVGAAVQSLINTLITLIATLLGWQLDSVQNIAGLATVDDTRIPDGSSKTVRTLWDSFTLDKTDTTSVVDGITVVATMSGTGRWLRDLQPTSTVWSNQAIWYVDVDNGSDENDGLTDSTELATFAEFRRRVEPYGVIVEMTVTIETDLPADDPIGLNCTGEQVTVEGVPTIVYTGSVLNFEFDGVTNVPPRFDDAGLDIASNIRQHIRFTSGAADGQGCWILEDLGANKVRTSVPYPFVFGFGAASTPGDGDTYVVETFPLATFSRIQFRGIIRFSRLHHRGYDNWATSIIQSPNVQSRASQINQGIETGFFTHSDCIGTVYASDLGGLVYAGAYGSMIIARPATVSFYSQPSMLDSSIPQSEPFNVGGKLALFFTDLWVFGNISNYVFTMQEEALFDMGSYRLRGSPVAAGADRLMSMATGSRFLTIRTDHTVTEETIRILDIGQDVELNSQTPIIDPSSGVQIGLSDSANLGAIGPIQAGIKSTLSNVDGTNYALQDFTESATNIIPYVVNNHAFIRNLRAHLGTKIGADEVAVNVLVDSGAGFAATGVTLSMTDGGGISGSDTEFADTGNSFLVAPGDRVAFQTVRTGGGATGGADLSLSLECG